MASIPKRYLVRLVTVTALVGALVHMHPAAATHKVHHRYTVWGEIKYEDGEPAADVEIRLTVKDDAPMGDTKTDHRGRYRILLHVHNEDLYKVFNMHVNNVHRKIRILFSPNDHQTERGQRVDLVVKRQGEYDSSAAVEQ